LNYFPYIFVGYLLSGIALVLIRSRSHAEIDSIRRVLEETAMVPVVAAAVQNAELPQGTAPLTA
jgi:hypothetical protein